MNLNSSDIGKLRLQSQQLNETKLKGAGEMVTWFGAVQGQEYALTKWGLGLRLSNLSDTDIERELSDGGILRTHLLRPTWHFVASDDISWLLELTAPRVKLANAYWYRKAELDNATFSKCNDILVKLLQEGKQLTRTEINREFVKEGILAQGPRLGYIMMQSELEGIICSGARRGKQFTYALLGERVKGGKKFQREEALSELAKRYILSRGPATVADFSTWSGLTLADCRLGIKLNKSRFKKISSGKNEYYFSVKLNLNIEKDPALHLLPIYDEFIMGYKDRSAILEYKDSLKQNQAFLFDNTIIYNGQIIGTWKRVIRKSQIDLEFDFFKPVKNNRNSMLEDMVRRFSSFHKMTVNYEM